MPLRPVKIDRSLINRLLGDPSYVKLLPPLETLLQKRQQGRKKRGCGGCGGSTNALKHVDYEEALRSIANLLTNDQLLRKQLREKLKASQLIVKYRQVTGKGAMEKRF